MKYHCFMLTGMLQVLIEELRRDAVIYNVADEVDESLFWMYATLHEGRSAPGYVVTNSFFRKKSDAVVCPFVSDARSAVLWQLSQVVSFDCQDDKITLQGPSTCILIIFSDATVLFICDFLCCRQVQELANCFL